MSQKILIVDDEENIIISLKFLMEQAGYDVAVALTGEDALAQLPVFQPDLIILDVMLPGIDGYEVCRRIHADARFPHVKIVMLTAKGREMERQRGIRLGADAYITKPFSTKELLQQVRILVELPTIK